MSSSPFARHAPPKYVREPLPDLAVVNDLIRHGVFVWDGDELASAADTNNAKPKAKPKAKPNAKSKANGATSKKKVTPQAKTAKSKPREKQCPKCPSKSPNNSTYCKNRTCNWKFKPARKTKDPTK